MGFHLRQATLEDIPQLRILISASVHSLHTAHYTQAQISGALIHVYGVDTQIIKDGHYFVVTPSPANPTLIACGGWSNRSTLFGSDAYIARDDDLLDPKKDAAKIRALFVHPDWVRKGIGRLIVKASEDAAKEMGFKRLELGATLNGVAFYEQMGYTLVEGGKRETDVGDGLKVGVVKMEKVFALG